MRVLPFNVNQQLLEKADETAFESLVRGSNGYLKCSFSFDESWNEYNKAIEFFSPTEKYYFYLDENNSINVPSEITKLSYFKVKVYGIKNKNVVFSTNAVFIKQKRGN